MLWLKVKEYVFFQPCTLGTLNIKTNVTNQCKLETVNAMYWWHARGKRQQVMGKKEYVYSELLEHVARLFLNLIDGYLACLSRTLSIALRGALKHTFSIAGNYS